MAVPSHQWGGNGDWGSGEGRTRVLFGRAGRGEKEAGGCELGRRVSALPEAMADGCAELHPSPRAVGVRVPFQLNQAYRPI